MYEPLHVQVVGVQIPVKPSQLDSQTFQLHSVVQVLSDDAQPEF
jgi:hypothetical protein